ncbi:hypothetical protein [Micromonospora sp. NPDC048830]|uniref:hypothetical protein n=1 Tax=Micromonospora sp. NPDC048830 TaxID=3364257 RepID=UPI0037247C0A
MPTRGRRAVRTAGGLGMAALLAAAGVLVAAAPARAVATRTVAFWRTDEPAHATAASTTTTTWTVVLRAAE